MQGSVNSLASFSFLTPHGYQSSPCGYCKTPETSEKKLRTRGAYYAHSTCLTAEHYQILIDRGWRRSGFTLYKPDQMRSCCPHYTIRLPASEFKPSRDQRQALHRWNKYVLGDNYMEEHTKQHPLSKQQKMQNHNTFNLQKTIHASEYSWLTCSLKPAHHFEVTLESNHFSEEKYELFEQYQRLVHKDLPCQISKGGFRSFLCRSPIQRTAADFQGRPRLLGSFHQCYRLDGRLIALAVLDLLPDGVSSVYLLYHVEYERFSFGKLSALREIALAAEEGFKNYYMGYYIHSCRKMRYKADYRPQYVLDPDTYEWDILGTELTRKLDERKFVSLSRDRMRGGSQDVMLENDHDSTDFATPASAADSGKSLFGLRFPGMMSATDVEGADLGSILVRTSKGASSGYLFPAKALIGWNEDSNTDTSDSIKAKVAELVGGVGTLVAGKMILDL